MTPPGSSPSPDAGFTLLELLVSLALVAVMAATMSMTLTQLRPLQVFQQRLNEADAADAVVGVIARDLQAAVRLPLIEAGSSSNVLFRGGPQGMIFSAVVATGFRRSGLREVSYELAGEADRKLVRRLKLRRFGSGTEAVGEELPLDATSLRLAFLVVTDGGPVWQDQFAEINGLPKAVLVEMRSQASKRVQATRVIVLDREAERAHEF